VEEKVGKLFVVPARNLDQLTHFVRDLHAGGVIWFETTARKAALVNAELRRLAREPLLISADLEAGMGMRFTDTTWWPPAMALAATGDADLAEEQARVTAREALAIGVNHILAPVADVNVDPKNPVINTRSFGEDPQVVARYVAAYVRGIQGEGALATAKHFPGHGDTRVDSHRALPVLDVSRERLERVELVPFRAAIGAGVASVMIGHLAVPELDDTPAPMRHEFENAYGTRVAEVARDAAVPATVSARIIGDLLRRDLGFEGLVISDSFDMGGLAAHFDPGEAAVRAIEAGMDQILFSADTEAAIAAVLRAVRSGRIAESRIDESVERVRHGVEQASGLPMGVGRGRPEACTTPESIAERAITLVRDDSGLLPLTARNVIAVVVSDFPEQNPLPEAVRGFRFVTANAETKELNIDADVIVLLLALRPKSGAGRIAVPRAVRELAERHAKKIIAISFGSPYVVRDLGPISTYICAYGIQPVMQRAAIRALRGEAPMQGKLPVTL
jgi:beta-glucosidase-like glycosyl hydrolase